MTSRKRGTDFIHRSCGRISVPERAPAAYELWQQGMTPKEIAVQFGVTSDTVTEWIQKVQRAVIDKKRLSNS
jgi:uncharacterized protein YjcR